MKPVSFLAFQRLAAVVMKGPEIETAGAQLCRWAEILRQSNAARIHTKIIRRLPLKLSRHGNWWGGNAPMTIRPPRSYIRRSLVHQPSQCFGCRRLQLGHGRRVGLELLALLDAERQEHTHHLEVAGLHRLFVQHAGETGEERFVVLDEAVVPASNVAPPIVACRRDSFIVYPPEKAASSRQGFLEVAAEDDCLAIVPRGNKMSALGQKQTYAVQQPMSALPPIATAKADFPQKACPLYPR